MITNEPNAEKLKSKLITCNQTQQDVNSHNCKQMQQSANSTIAAKTQSQTPTSKSKLYQIPTSSLPITALHYFRTQICNYRKLETISCNELKACSRLWCISCNQPFCTKLSTLHSPELHKLQNQKWHFQLWKPACSNWAKQKKPAKQKKVKKPETS